MGLGKARGQISITILLVTQLIIYNAPSCIGSTCDASSTLFDISDAHEKEFSASSSYDASSTPLASRWSTFEQAWTSCRSLPDKISKCGEGKEETASSKEWIQVCFPALWIVLKVEIQKPQDHNPGFVKSFSLFYSYKKTGTFYGLRTNGKLMIFNSPKDRTSLTHYMPVGVRLRCLRLQVESFEGAVRPSLRWNVKGCQKGKDGRIFRYDEATSNTVSRIIVGANFIGQAGIKFNWEILGASSSFSIASTTSSEDVKGLHNSTIEIELLNNPELCMKKSGLYTCTTEVLCTVSYEDLADFNQETFRLQKVYEGPSPPTDVVAKEDGPSALKVTWKTPDVRKVNLKYVIGYQQSGSKTRKEITTSESHIRLGSLPIYTEHAISVKVIVNTGVFQSRFGAVTLARTGEGHILYGI